MHQVVVRQGPFAFFAGIRVKEEWRLGVAGEQQLLLELPLSRVVLVAGGEFEPGGAGRSNDMQQPLEARSTPNRRLCVNGVVPRRHDDQVMAALGP